MKVRFKGQDQPGFYAEVRQQVNQYFAENNLSRNANGEMVAKTLFFFALLVGSYGLLLSNQFGLWANLGLAMLLGMVQAFIGFNVSHDAIHGAYSSSKKINKILSYTFNVIGANAYVWSVTHNKVHHTYTNIPGHDEDLEVAPGMVRLSPLEEPKPIMRFQHIYAFFLYSLTSLSWVFRKDFKKFFQKKVGHINNTNHPKIEYFNLFFFKLLYYTLFIVVPLLVMDITWWQFIIGFLAMHFAEGLVLGLVFQLAHVVEGIDYPEPDEAGLIDDAWAIHQMHTTADFARNSPVAKFLCGGLNFQIEHHLFPQTCHVHYPKISKIVEATAMRYGIPYHDNKTFGLALKSHYQSLKRLGRKEVVKETTVAA